MYSNYKTHKIHLECNVFFYIFTIIFSVRSVNKFYNRRIWCFLNYEDEWNVQMNHNLWQLYGDDLLLIIQKFATVLTVLQDHPGCQEQIDLIRGLGWLDRLKWKRLKRKTFWTIGTEKSFLACVLIET